jgi:glycosyltransferase involved in cell wall biosynthesis
MASSGSVVVIPVHNEAPTIGIIVAAARMYLPVIVVDDASDDGSGPLAAATGATVLTLSKHQGKGAALRYGFAEAWRRGAEAVVTLDGDGQHDPHDIPRLLAASQRWPKSIIIGGRLDAAAEIPRHRLHAIRVASFWISWLGGCSIQDTQSGFRVYPTAILRSLPLRHGRFLLESEVLLKAAQAGYNIRELPIRAIYRSDQRSQYRPLWDGMTAATYLLYHGIRFWLRQSRQRADIS